MPEDMSNSSRLDAVLDVAPIFTFYQICVRQGMSKRSVATVYRTLAHFGLILIFRRSLLMKRIVLVLMRICLVMGMMLTPVLARPLPAQAADVNLRGYWALDDGSGTTAADSSGYGYTGTLTGGSWSSAHAPTTFANTGS